MRDKRPKFKPRHSKLNPNQQKTLKYDYLNVKKKAKAPTDKKKEMLSFHKSN